MIEEHTIEFRRHGGTTWGAARPGSPFAKIKDRTKAFAEARRALRNGIGAGYPDYQVRVVSTQYQPVYLEGDRE